MLVKIDRRGGGTEGWQSPEAMLNEGATCSSDIFSLGLIFFFVFHVVLAAIQFRPATAFLFATMATGGLRILTGLQIAGLFHFSVVFA